MANSELISRTHVSYLIQRKITHRVKIREYFQDLYVDTLATETHPMNNESAGR